MALLSLRFEAFPPTHLCSVPPTTSTLPPQSGAYRDPSSHCRRRRPRLRFLPRAFAFSARRRLHPHQRAYSPKNRLMASILRSETQPREHQWQRRRRRRKSYEISKCVTIPLSLPMSPSTPLPLMLYFSSPSFLDFVIVYSWLLPLPLLPSS